MQRQAPLIGRHYELSKLLDWLTKRPGGVCLITGVGGSGKTALVEELVYQYTMLPGMEDERDGIVWCELTNVTSVDALLGRWIDALVTPRPTHLPVALEDKLALLFNVLRRRRVLLILDNLEALLLDKSHTQGLPSKFEDFQLVLERFTREPHQSSLLITTRAVPPYLQQLTEDVSRVAVQPLAGLLPEQGMLYLRRCGISGDESLIEALVTHYDGNPLALKLAAAVMHADYAGDIEPFLREGAPALTDIVSLLDVQVARMTGVMRDLLCELTIARGPVTLPVLFTGQFTQPPPHDVLAAIDALGDAGLLRSQQPKEQAAHRSTGTAVLTLEHSVMVYVTGKLLAAIQAELETGQFFYLHHYTLCNTDGDEQIKTLQTRDLIAPLAHRLQERFGGDRVQRYLVQILALGEVFDPEPKRYLVSNVRHLIHQYGVTPHTEIFDSNIR